jgi:hypothetical protein
MSLYVEAYCEILAEYLPVLVYVDFSPNGQLDFWREAHEDDWLFPHEPITFDMVEAACTRWFGRP